jgi:hypothetical protein
LPEISPKYNVYREIIGYSRAGLQGEESHEKAGVNLMGSVFLSYVSLRRIGFYALNE